MGGGRLLWAASIILLVALPASLPFWAAGASEGLGPVGSFVVFYGSLTGDVVERFPSVDLAIISSLEDPGKLQGRAGVVLGYVSISTLGGWEPWAGGVGDDMVVARSPVWGEVIVNVSDPRWASIILGEAVPGLLERGFDGVFLDNLDQVDAYPWMREAIVDLVGDIRRSYPDAVIVVNRGFSIVEEIAPFVDGVLFESFASYYDWEEKAYKVYQGGDLDFIKMTLERLTRLSREHGFSILLLAYGEPEKPGWGKVLETACDLNKPYGYPLYIGDALLQRLGWVNPCDSASATNAPASERGFLAREWGVLLGVLLIVAGVVLFAALRR